MLALSGCALTKEAKEAKFLSLGKQQYAKKDYARAVIEFRNAIRIAPNDAEAYYQLGLAYTGTGDVRAAYAALKKATDLNPKHADAQLKLASLMLSSRNQELHEEAEKRVQRLWGRRTHSAEALNLLAFSELRLGKRGRRHRVSSASPHQVSRRFEFLGNAHAGQAGQGRYQGRRRNPEDTASPVRPNPLRPPWLSAGSTL